MTPGLDLDVPSATGDPELRRLLDVIIADFAPLEIILFGSRARGDDNDDSDFDVAVVMPEGTNRGKTAGDIYRALGRVGERTRAIDILVFTAGELERGREDIGSLTREIARDGRVVHGQGPSPVPDLIQADATRRQATVDAWVAGARADLAAARVLSTMDRDSIDAMVVAFHAQQCVEKALKAWLLHLGIDHRPTHDLNVLVDLLPSAAMKSVDPAVRHLARYAVMQWHPAPSIDPTAFIERTDWPEAELAVGLAQAVMDLVVEQSELKLRTR